MSPNMATTPMSTMNPAAERAPFRAAAATAMRRARYPMQPPRCNGAARCKFGRLGGVLRAPRKNALSGARSELSELVQVAYGIVGGAGAPVRPLDEYAGQAERARNLQVVVGVR